MDERKKTMKKMMSEKDPLTIRNFCLSCSITPSLLLLLLPLSCSCCCTGEFLCDCGGVISWLQP